MIKSGINIKKIKNINYILKNGTINKEKAWLSDLFSFSYDYFMKNKIFPKKFDASYTHHEIALKKLYNDIHDKKILELATGSGNLAKLISPSNMYYGIDISKGLLKQAYRKFKKNGFQNFELFNCSVENIPFENESFNTIICNLSLNFFANQKKVFETISNLLKPEGDFFCSIPILDNIYGKTNIKGNLYHESDYIKFSKNNNLKYQNLNVKNGVIHYFKCIKN